MWDWSEKRGLGMMLAMQRKRKHVIERSTWIKAPGKEAGLRIKKEWCS